MTILRSLHQFFLSKISNVIDKPPTSDFFRNLNTIFPKFHPVSEINDEDTVMTTTIKTIYTSTTKENLDMPTTVPSLIE